jgi:hypothetical protein
MEPVELLDVLDPWARRLELQTSLSSQQAVEALASNCQATVHTYRNSSRPFIGVVSESPFRFSHRRRVKKHDPRQYRLTVHLHGRSDWGPRGTLLTFVARPGFEYYGVLAIAVAVTVAYPSGSLIFVTLALATAQTLALYAHISEAFRVLRELFPKQDGTTGATAHRGETGA